MEFAECNCGQDLQDDSVCFAGEFCAEDEAARLIAAGALGLVDLMN